MRVLIKDVHFSLRSHLYPLNRSNHIHICLSLLSDKGIKDSSPKPESTAFYKSLSIWIELLYLPQVIQEKRDLFIQEFCIFRFEEDSTCFHLRSLTLIAFLHIIKDINQVIVLLSKFLHPQFSKHFLLTSPLSMSSLPMSLAISSSSDFFNLS